MSDPIEDRTLDAQVEEEEGLERTVRELTASQLELEMQNEELRRIREQLEEARDRYFELYEAAPVAYLTLNPDGRIVGANLTAATMLQTERRNLVGRALTGWMSAADAERFQAYRRALFEERKRGGGAAPGKSLEVWLSLRSGKRLRVQLESLLAVSETDGVWLRTAVVDITERQLALDALRDREARLSAILATVADGIVTLDGQHRIDSINAAAEHIFGWPAGELVGRPLEELVTEEARGQLAGLLAEAAPGQGPRHSRELEGCRRDGTRLPLEVSVGVAADDKSRARVAVLRDITERKRREAELHESLLRFRHIAEQIRDVFFISERVDRSVRYVSPAFSEVFGRPPEAVLGVPGDPWLSWLPPDERERVRLAMERAETAGTPFDEELRLLWPDGSEHIVRVRAWRDPTQDRRIGIASDITEERRVQDELRQAQRLESIGTLASGIAHDFNNLLMGVAGCGTMALRHLEPKHPARPHVERGLAASMRGASLARRIFSLSDRRRGMVHRFELDALLEDAEDLLRHLVGEHIRVEVRLAATGCALEADPGDLEQALMNLASNARDAMPGGGVLTVSTHRLTQEDGTCVELRVHDTGIGMDAATRARIFDPFFTTKEVGKGTGLGLSTVFGLVRRLGGRVSVESELGRGTCFTLRLPCNMEARAGAGDTEVGTSARRGAVLVVEDDELVRDTVAVHLDALGYEPVTVASGEAAARELHRRRGHVLALLTDVMMPGRLGGDVAASLRAAWPGLPVVFMSAHPAEELVRLGRVSADAPVLAKPFDAAGLAAALDRVLGSRPAPPEVPPVEGRRVLLVDDDPDVAEFMRELLELEGHRAAAAHSGEEALRLAQEIAPQVVISDLALGRGLTGEELARRLRADGGLRETRLIAVTGYTDDARHARARAAGFDAVLVKPVELQRLLEEIARAPE